MRSLLMFLLSLFILSGCGKATFDNKGSQQVSSFEDEVEVIPEDEAGTLSDEEGAEKDGDDGLGDGLDDDDDDGEDHDDDKDHHKDGKSGRDKDHKSGCKDKNKNHHHSNCNSGCDDKTKTPHEIFKNPKLFRPFLCHKNMKKVWICQYPSGDDEKRHDLCVNENSIRKLLHERRQDIFVLGKCSAVKSSQ